eukprot:gnl/TRDRNA2_/TRDRNA2_202490_c0_seq1.p1 gnl/TRDRNA2_/TRDRNA2_202490_c0~~gnl/TRDRNA2_/TRDRNA2_202490_c0_seq1.p1  ORF type:complete len:226 (+),score=38.64 gnl/TRDRNA2_/TRDRNA2_202490_c0_seq1:56-733(+)
MALFKSCCCGGQNDSSSKVDKLPVGQGSKFDNGIAEVVLPFPVHSSESAVTFAVHIARGEPAQPLGLDLEEDIDKRTLYVNEVRAGPIASWNSSRDKSLQVTAGDRITQVNGVFGSTDKIVQEMKEALTLKLIVRRPAEVTISVSKASGPIGLKFDPEDQDCMSLIIVEVTKDSSSANSFCIENFGWDLKPGDRVVQVNSTRGTAAQMLQLLMSESSVEMIIDRM